MRDWTSVWTVRGLFEGAVGAEGAPTDRVVGVVGGGVDLDRAHVLCVSDREEVGSLGDIAEVEGTLIVRVCRGDLFARVRIEELDPGGVDGVAAFGKDRTRDFMEPAEWNADVGGGGLLTGVDLDGGGPKSLGAITQLSNDETRREDEAPGFVGAEKLWMLRSYGVKTAR